MSKNDKNEKDELEDKILCLGNEGRDFEGWRIKTMEDGKVDHEQIPTYLDTGRRWIVPLITAIPNGMVAENTANDIKKNVLNKLIQSGVADFSGQVKLERKFYNFLWSRLSDVSQDAVRDGTETMDFAAIEAAADPYKLYDLIRERILVNPSGNPAMKAWERKQMVELFVKFKQLTIWSIHLFKRKYENWLKNLVGMSVPKYSDEDAALGFLDRLDPTRYSKFQLKIENDATSPGGKLLYNTLKLMYDAAKSYKVEVVIKKGPNEPAERAFALMDNVRPIPHKKPVIIRRGDSPPPKQQRQQQQQQQQQSQKHDQSVASSNQTNKRKRDDEPPADGDLSQYRCKICRIKGAHVWTDCPKRRLDYIPKHQRTDQPQQSRQVATYQPHHRDNAYVVAMGEYEDADHELVTHRICVVGDSMDAGERAFYAGESCLALLDNQASQSIVRNPAMLHSIKDIVPYSLGGVNVAGEGLTIRQAGSINDLSGINGEIGIAPNAAANILSQARLRDSGHQIRYLHEEDLYHVQGDTTTFVFERQLVPTYNGKFKRSAHYSCDLAAERVMIATVAENMQNYPKRERKEAIAARDLNERMGYPSTKNMIKILNGGVLNCPVMPQHVLRADAILGPPTAVLKGKTNKQASAISSSVLGPAPILVQKQQSIEVDLMFINKEPYVLAIMEPLGYTFCQHIKDKSAQQVGPAILDFVNAAKLREYEIQFIKSDGEGAVAALKDQLVNLGVDLDVAGPGQHVPRVENRIQHTKKKVRSFYHGLPFLMPRNILIGCVMFCVFSLNIVSVSGHNDTHSPFEHWNKCKLDAERHFPEKFGSYCHATTRDSNNSMSARTEGGIYLYPKCTLATTTSTTNTFCMYSFAAKKCIFRDQVKFIPMPDEVINFLNTQAEKDGYSRSDMPLDGDNASDLTEEEEEETQMAPMHALPEWMDLSAHLSRDLAEVIPPSAVSQTSESGVTGDTVDQSEAREVSDTLEIEPTAEREQESGPNTRSRVTANQKAAALFLVEHLMDNSSQFALYTNCNQSEQAVAFSHLDRARWEARRQAARRDHWVNREFAFKMSVNAAIQIHGEAARSVIEAELVQMLDKRVFHPVYRRDLNATEIEAIIRSSMFASEKYNADGTFDKMKARLVAGGDQQDKQLYENLSSPTAATSSVFIIAAIAASEGRLVEVVDITGAYLNASIKGSGPKVHMELNKTLTSMMVKLDSSYLPFVKPDGTCIVELDKALYGCVQAASLWHEHIKSNLLAYGFVENPIDKCVFNKECSDGHQITIVLHVDDLMVTSKSQRNLDEFGAYLKTVYPETRTKKGLRVDYLGMTFDFTTKGEVRVTMDNSTNDILAGCGPDITAKATPAAATLFDTRETTKASVKDQGWFHTHVAKLLYLAKRVRPEMLTAVSFLTTRVQACDQDDLAKLRRALGYLLGTRHRGIVLRVGESMDVRAFIDASYGVHTASGKSHTGCAIVVGYGGPVYTKSTKQKIVTKSSTEAELVGVSDTASQAIFLRNFILAQGYDIGPAILYQDNLSCMALIKRGGPASERSRHIAIRHFWIQERVESGEVLVEHMPTEEMMANILTKPVQGAQFLKERYLLTNWD